MARLRPVDHEDRLSVVDHLGELRSRLVVSLLALGVASGLCFWQDERVLALFNAPLDGRQPITFGVAEPFSTTVTVSVYAGLLIALPVILHQLYSFVLPAFSPSERRVAVPLLLMVPVLFVGGVAFGYTVVIPKALDFLTHFNADQFDIELRARDYYGFVGLMLGVMGALFQVPVGVLAATRLGITTPQQLRRHRRHAIVVIAVLAMLLPGADPVTMLVMMAPLIVLYELSIVLAQIFGGSATKADMLLEGAD